ncbi:hypothetical protein [Streptosporangium subroseum]|nr:hypothetical protein OHB15_47770 [Streptosporangium subroseum]
MTADMQTRVWASLELSTAAEEYANWLADERDELAYANRHGKGTPA